MAGGYEPQARAIAAAAVGRDPGPMTVAESLSHIAPRLLRGLTAIAEGAPKSAVATVPVHADCHWGNWLVSSVGSGEMVESHNRHSPLIVR